MIVPDASVVVDLLLQRPGVDVVRARLFDAANTLHAPYLLDVEVVHVLRGFEARGDIASERAREAIGLLGTLPISRYDHTPLLDRIWALRQNLTAYDAAYVALAEALGAPLLTRDRKLAKTSGHRATIKLV